MKVKAGSIIYCQLYGKIKNGMSQYEIIQFTCLLLYDIASGFVVN